MSRGLIANSAAAVLCGGQSRRMGRDKALLELQSGASLLRQNAEKLAGLFGRVAYLADNAEKLNDRSKYGSFAVVTDHYPQTGPMGAVCTALEALNAPWVFAMACDMPAVDLDLIDRMAALRAENQVVLCRHGQAIEPLFAFYHQSCLPEYRRLLAAGIHGLRQGFAALRVAFLEVPQARAEAAFVNLNTRQDHENWLKSQG